MTEFSDLETFLRAADMAREAVHKNPTAANIKAFKAASAAVDEAKAKAAAEHEQGPAAPVFATIKTALEYINGKGYKCGKSKLSGDVKNIENPLRRNSQGLFTQAALDAYCKTLTPLEGVDSSDKVDDLVMRKMHADTELAEIKMRMASMEEKIRNKELISPTEAFLIFAGLFAQIRADIDSFFYGKVPEMVLLCDGDETKISDVLQLLFAAKAEWMNRFYKSWKNQQPLAVPVAAVREAVRDLGEVVEE